MVKYGTKICIIRALLSVQIIARYKEIVMRHWYDNLDQKKFDVSLSFIDEKIAELCDEK